VSVRAEPGGEHPSEEPRSAGEDNLHG